MKSAALAVLIGAMLTVDQHDRYRSALDHPSASVSPGGQYIAFATYAQLTDADTDQNSDIYVLDRARQQITLESTGSAGATNCLHPGISHDGRSVVWESDGHVAWRDRTHGVVRLLTAGQQPTITGDGRTIVFTSTGDVYTLDVQTGKTTRLSADVTALDGRPAASVNPSASADGRYVTFSALPPRAGVRLPVSEVFVHDTQATHTTRAGTGWSPSISGDGRYLAFVAPVDRLHHVFLADLQSRTTRLITRSAKRGRANGSSANPQVSADGRFVVFQSQASDLVADDDFNLLWDVFVYDRATDATVRVSGDPDGTWMEPSIGPAIDASGSVVAFSSRHPTGAEDKDNDLDLYVADLAARSSGRP